MKDDKLIMTIRTAEKQDLDVLSDIELKCFPKAEAARYEDIRDRLAIYPNHYYLLEVDGRVVSYINGMVTNERKLTDEMYENASMHDESGKWQMIFGVDTLPDYRKRGYAARLMEYVIEQAKKEGRYGLVLTCKDKLVHYYEKFGFVSEGVSQSVHGGVTWYDMRLTFLDIEVAKETDAQELLEIYRPYVEETAVSFEYDVPGADEFARRIADILEKYPYIVARLNSELVGYAYAATFRPRAAYDWSVETTIYIKRGFNGLGIGRKLYECLEELLKKQNILNANACIAFIDYDKFNADGSSPDIHLDNNSYEFHKHMGYSLVGTFHNSGYKFDTWYDMIWMEKILGEHTKKQLKVIPFREL